MFPWQRKRTAPIKMVARTAHSPLFNSISKPTLPLHQSPAATTPPQASIPSLPSTPLTTRLSSPTSVSDAQQHTLTPLPIRFTPPSTRLSTTPMPLPAVSALPTTPPPQASRPSLPSLSPSTLPTTRLASATSVSDDPQHTLTPLPIRFTSPSTRLSTTPMPSPAVSFTSSISPINSPLQTLSSSILSSLLTGKKLNVVRKLDLTSTEDVQLCEPSTSQNNHTSTTTTIAPKKLIEDLDTSDVSINPSPIKIKKKSLKLKNCERFMCKYVMKKGSRKGQRCDRFALRVGDFCSVHSKGKSKSSCSKLAVPVVAVPNTVPLLRIHRLKANVKYHVIQKSYQNSKYSLIKSEDKYFKVKIPKTIQIPLECENSGYLIREKKETWLSVWKP
jgi:hypothetical protein